MSTKTISPRTETRSGQRQKKESQFKDVWRRLRKNKLAMLGLLVIILLVLSAIFAPLITAYEYDKMDYANINQFPNAAHPLGTDNYGRDLLTRIIYGGRTSLLVSIVSVAIGLVLGGGLGAYAAFYGGKKESIVMRALDILMAIPPLLLAVAISAAMGSGIFNCAIAIGVASVPLFARVIRASALSIVGQEYIEAARSCGVSNLKIIFKHVIPNSLGPILVQSTLRIGESIMQISSLSFIGLGVQPPTPEWGNMLALGREYIRDFWPAVIFPGVAIMITLIAFNVFGDGLRDALDPRLKQ